MEMFKEWWNRKGIETGRQEPSSEKMAEIAWRECLKWVLNHPDLIDHYMLDYVKEELNND